MKQAGRPIGAHIRAICTWLEANGPATSSEIQRGTGILPQSLPSSCMRAVCFGLLNCEGTTRKTYRIAPGWQERVTSKDRPKLARFPGEMKDQERVSRPISIPKVNSVWALGA